MAWLGVSRVRMGVIDDKGNYVVVHQFQNANVTDGVYLRNANLPIRFEIRNTAGLADTLRTICATVKSEAEDQNTFGVNQAISLGVAGKTKTTIYTPLISIRMDTTSFNSLPNRISLRDLGITLSCATSVTQWALVYNATLTAPTWNAMPTYAGQTMTRVSGMVFDTVASAYTGGVILAQGYVAAGGVGGSATSGAASQTVLSKVPLHTGIKGNVGVPLTLVVRGVTAAPTAVVGGFNWREIY